MGSMRLINSTNDEKHLINHIHGFKSIKQTVF
jgi:hypothetical protein